jgi:hypothetical protein
MRTLAQQAANQPVDSDEMEVDQVGRAGLAVVAAARMGMCICGVAIIRHPGQVAVKWCYVQAYAAFWEGHARLVPALACSTHTACRPAAVPAAVVPNCCRVKCIMCVPCSSLQFEFNYSSLEKPHIQNDTVTLHKKAAKDHQVRACNDCLLVGRRSPASRGKLLLQ